MDIETLAQQCGVSEKDVNLFVNGLTDFINNRNFVEHVLSGELDLFDVVKEYNRIFSKISLKTLSVIGNAEERKEFNDNTEFLNSMYDTIYGMIDLKKEAK